MGDTVKDLSKPYRGGVRIKGGVHVDFPPFLNRVGGEVSYGKPKGFDASLKTGFSRSGFGTTVDDETGDTTTSVPGPGGFTYGSASENKDGTGKVGFGIGGRLGKRAGVKLGVESWGNGDIAFPGEYGTTKVAPQVFTKATRLGTKNDFGMPEIQVDAYAELGNGKKIRIRRDKVAVPAENIDDMLYGDFDRREAGSFPVQEVMEAFNRALKEDSDLFAGTPNIERNAFDTGRSQSPHRVDLPMSHSGIVSSLMGQAKDIAKRPQTAANIRQIARALWTAKAGRVAP